MNPMRLKETVKKMERYVLPTVKDNDVEVKRSLESLKGLSSQNKKPVTGREG